MTLPTSGPLSLQDIANEFGGSAPHSLSEYYAGGGLVPAGASGVNGAIPASGALSLSQFYGAANLVFAFGPASVVDTVDIAQPSDSGILSILRSLVSSGQVVGLGSANTYFSQPVAANQFANVYEARIEGTLFVGANNFSHLQFRGQTVLQITNNNVVSQNVAFSSAFFGFVANDSIGIRLDVNSTIGGGSSTVNASGDVVLRKVGTTSPVFRLPFSYTGRST